MYENFDCCRAKMKREIRKRKVITKSSRNKKKVLNQFEKAKVVYEDWTSNFEDTIWTSKSNLLYHDVRERNEDVSCLETQATSVFFH